MERKSGQCFFNPPWKLRGSNKLLKCNRNDWGFSERILQAPPMAGSSKGAANQQFPTTTSLAPIAELKELSVAKVPPETQPPLEVEFSEASNVDCPTRAKARPITEADFLTTGRKFKPGYETDIASFFDDILAGEARKMGRPEREYKSSL